jgi:hypothetical protein
MADPTEHESAAPRRGPKVEIVGPLPDFKAPDYVALTKALEGSLASLEGPDTKRIEKVLASSIGGPTRTPLREFNFRRPASSDDIDRLESAMQEVTQATLAIVGAVERSSKSADRIARWVMWLTVALVVMTAALLWHGA